MGMKIDIEKLSDSTLMALYEGLIDDLDNADPDALVHHGIVKSLVNERFYEVPAEKVHTTHNENGHWAYFNRRFWREPSSSGGE